MLVTFYAFAGLLSRNSQSPCQKETKKVLVKCIAILGKNEDGCQNDQ